MIQQFWLHHIHVLGLQQGLICCHKYSACLSMLPSTNAANPRSHQDRDAPFLCTAVGAPAELKPQQQPPRPVAQQAPPSNFSETPACNSKMPCLVRNSSSSLKKLHAHQPQGHHSPDIFCMASPIVIVDKVNVAPRDRFGRGVWCTQRHKSMHPAP